MATTVGEESSVRGTVFQEPKQLFKLKSDVAVPNCASSSHTDGSSFPAPRRKSSYKDVLLQSRCCDAQVFGHRCCSQKRAPCPEPEESGDGCLVVKPWCIRPHPMDRPDGTFRLEPQRCARYLRWMKGRCFNCLARDHKVASCQFPTRCWVCRESWHISYKCPSYRRDLTTSHCRNSKSVVREGGQEVICVVYLVGRRCGQISPNKKQVDELPT